MVGFLCPMTLDEMKSQVQLFEDAVNHGLRAKARPTPIILDNGKKCRDCKHAVRFSQSKVWHKCLLNRDRWTGGVGTDIRLKDPACGLFAQE